MKNGWWILLILGLASACLERADCIKNGDTALVINFKKLLDGKADTITIMNVVATGSDSVFYKTEPDALNTIVGTVLVAVNPYAEETEFIFEFEAGLKKTLKVGYRNEIRFISEECGSDRVQVDLSILETQFDSVRVVQHVLTRDRHTNIEIFN